MSTAHRIIKQMKNKGNTVLGVGYYSAALSMKDPNKIVKVGSDIEDPCLMYYNSLVAKISNNQHVPTVYSLYLDKDNGFYLAVLERLEETTLKDGQVCDLCRDFCNGYITSDEFLIYAEKYSSYIPNPSKMLDALARIKNLAETQNVKIDLHRGNFMLRDTILVITDPWSDDYLSYDSDLSVWADENIYQTA